MTRTRSSFPKNNHLTVAVLTLGLIIGPALSPLTASGRSGSPPAMKLHRAAAAALAPTGSREKVTPSDSAMKARVIENYGKLPLSFEPNQGQINSAVKFRARGRGYTLWLTATEAVLALRKGESGRMKAESEVPSDSAFIPHPSSFATLRLKLVGANTAPQVEGQEQLEGRSNYLIGNDRSQWHTDIPTYREVRYTAVWPGIDLVWYGRQHQLEYDFIVRPGADPAQIRLRFGGADQLRLDGGGNLVVETKAGEVVQHAPVIYQEGEQGRKTVAGKYILKGRREVGFTVAAYDASRPLVIDPQLVYSTYLGGSDVDNANGIAADGSGNAYITGRSIPADFPLENGIAETKGPHSGAGAAFVTKLNASGTDIIYSTFIGRPDVFTSDAGANAISVTSDGKACITGTVDNEKSLSGFPSTPNAYQDQGSNLACEAPYSSRGPCRNDDAFVTVLNAAGNGLFYSTFFGGTRSRWGDQAGFDEGRAIATDSAGRIYITGRTTSNDLPTKNAFQNSRRSSFGVADAFIAVFNPAAANGDDTLLYASYLGGSGEDVGKGIAVDAARNAYVVGSTGSNDLETKAPAGQSLPPLRAAFQGGGTDGFVAKIDTEASGDSSLTYLTYFGGNGNDRAEAVAVDAAQRAYITGATSSSATSFPLRNAFDSRQFNGEAFVAKLNADGTALFYSSFLGGDNGNTTTDGEEGLGLAIDSAGNAYVTGRTTSGATFPVGAVAPPFPANLQGTSFVAKIEASVSSTTVPRVLYATTFGGTGTVARAIALDPKGNVYLAGLAFSSLPTTPGAFQPTFHGLFNGTSDGFVAKIGSTFPDTIGVYRPSVTDFLLRNSNTAGNPDITVNFSGAGDIPLTGDWDSNGQDEVGVFRPSTGQFLLRRSNCFICLPGMGSIIFLNNFGQAGDLPVVGDWDGDGIDTVGVFRNGTFLLTNSPNINNSSPTVDITVTLGQAGDIPIVGDWNGDGIDTVGVFRPGAATFFLSNSFNGVVDIPAFAFGQPGFLPVAGDWDGDGVDTIGIFNPNAQIFALNNVNATGTGNGDIVVSFGQAGDQPLAGDWNGQP